MPYSIVRTFEERVAEYAGAKYGVAVESGTAAIFLSLHRRVYEARNVRPSTPGQTCAQVRHPLYDVVIPARTYPSVPCSIIHAGGNVIFDPAPWSGVYELKPLRIIDGALRFRRGMYEGGLHCLSFHVKKHLAIGRGGMILTDDEDAYKWLKKARFDGRDECDLNKDSFSMLGWNMYMSPDQAARGLMAFSIIKNRGVDPEDLDVAAQGYPDLSQYPVYR